MKKSFQKTLIAASVGAVLAVGSFSAIAGTPGTTNLLFPFITSEANAFTFISINNVAPGVATGVASNYHFTYATKLLSDANSTACTHLDGDAKATANDLMQFEVSNKVSLTALGGTSVPKFGPSIQGQRGMLIVNNATGANYGSGGVYAGNTLYGEARIINTATGLAMGYSTDDLHTATDNTTNGPDFASTAGPDAGVASKVTSWFPDSAVATSYYILPLANENVMSVLGNAQATYQGRAADGVFGGQYDNKEGFQSSTTKQAVTCFGIVTRPQLFGTGNVAFSANGGWATLAKTTDAAPTGTTATTTALIYKIESIASTAGFGVPVTFVTRAAVK